MADPGLWELCYQPYSTWGNWVDSRAFVRGMSRKLKYDRRVDLSLGPESPSIRIDSGLQIAAREYLAKVLVHRFREEYKPDPAFPMAPAERTLNQSPAGLELFSPQSPLHTTPAMTYNEWKQVVAENRQRLRAYGPDAQLLDTAVHDWVEFPRFAQRDIASWLVGERATLRAPVLVGALAAAEPSDRPLYRGIRVTPTAAQTDYKIGATVDVIPSAFSESLDAAVSHAGKGPNDATLQERVVLIVEQGAKALRIWPFGWYQNEFEWISGGRFVVLSNDVHSSGKRFITVRQTRSNKDQLYGS
jgi:hypothetical protein